MLLTQEKKVVNSAKFVEIRICKWRCYFEVQKLQKPRSQDYAIVSVIGGHILLLLTALRNENNCQLTAVACVRVQINWR